MFGQFPAGFASGNFFVALLNYILGNISYFSRLLNQSILMNKFLGVMFLIFLDVLSAPK